jgi:hypothetical protein
MAEEFESGDGVEGSGERTLQSEESGGAFGGWLSNGLLDLTNSRSSGV